MATKKDIEAFGMVLAEVVLRASGYEPSTQVCNEFAGRIMAEARQAGDEIQVFTVRSTGG